jgi:hypothetical protein
MGVNALDGAGKKTHLLCQCIPKTIILPRQARDRHSENSKKERYAFLHTAGWAYDNNTVPFPCGPENPIVSRSTDGKWWYLLLRRITLVYKPKDLIGRPVSLRCGMKTAGFEPKRPKFEPRRVLKPFFAIF